MFSFIDLKWECNVIYEGDSLDESRCICLLIDNKGCNENSNLFT